MTLNELKERLHIGETTARKLYRELLSIERVNVSPSGCRNPRYVTTETAFSVWMANRTDRSETPVTGQKNRQRRGSNRVDYKIPSR